MKFSNEYRYFCLFDETRYSVSFSLDQRRVYDSQAVWISHFLIKNHIFFLSHSQFFIRVCFSFPFVLFFVS